MSELLLLARIAVRNLFANFMNVVIGGIILVGTLLFVVGGSLLNSVDSAMSKSIIGSVAGHIQVYSSRSKDPLDLFDTWANPDLTAIPEFSKVKGPLLALDNVKTVVPMGVANASVMYGNTLDQVLEKLRKSVKERQAQTNPAQRAAVDTRIASLKSHVRQVVSVIQGDYAKLAVMSSKDAADPEAPRLLAKAASAEFWNGFDQDPFNHLEFLENRISSLLPDADFMFLSYIGTDVDAFQESFDRMQIVDGQAIPKGQRGILLSKYMYENQIKLKIAFRLDKLHEALHHEGKKIATDPDLQLMVKQNRNQTREILLQFDPSSAKKATAVLQGALGSKEQDLKKLLPEFLDTNDANLDERYRIFYAELVPLLELYRLRPGDMIAIKAFTKSGYVTSVNLKIYGTFQFKGLEKSGVAGSASLMDLMSFRDLYGYITPEKIAETERLKKEVGSRHVERDRAEADLFGGTTSVSQGGQARIDDQRELGDFKAAGGEKALQSRSYSKGEIESGVALNAAIILKDPSKLKETIREIEKVSERDKLDLKVVTWQKAAGNLGQFVFLAKLVLYFAVGIIFVVALVIINNAVMMATLQRIREIGTMRAIGAQRGFVLSLVVLETVFLGLVFGSVGTLLGSLVMNWLGNVGIPAGNEFLYFFFSGPRLHASLSAGSLIGAFMIIFIVTSASALYPAMIATRVSPLRAMQAED